MLTIASLSSFFGSIWFALLLGAVGFILGQCFPLFRKNK